MKNEPDATPSAPIRKMKFKPKIPPRKLAKTEVPKLESVETKEDVIDKELLAKLSSAKQTNDGSRRRVFKSERKVATPQVAIGCGGASMLARSYGNPTGSGNGLQLEGGADASMPSIQKEYVEPWDYAHSYYPVTLPLRRPYSGDPETLNELEFGEVSTISTQDESNINSAVELGLLEKREEAQMIFFQLPSSLPLAKQSGANAKSKGCSMDELPAGYMGKMLVYKSGAVKMKLGDAIFDVAPGVNCVFAQDVAAINTEEKHCCILGEVDKRAVITPDVESLLESIEKATFD